MADACECGDEPSGSIECGNFLTSCKPVRLSRRTLHHGVSIDIYSFRISRSPLDTLAFFSRSQPLLGTFILLAQPTCTREHTGFILALTQAGVTVFSYYFILQSSLIQVERVGSPKCTGANLPNCTEVRPTMQQP